MKRIYIYSIIIPLYAGCSDNNMTREEKPSPVSQTVLNERWKAISIAKDSLREGDLVVRCGNDFTSESLRDFSQQDKLYSHSGIALMNDGGMLIYSNMAGDLNPDEIMRRDPVDSFLTPVSNVAFGVYRYDLSDVEKEKLKSVVLEHYNNKLQFDMNFDLSTDDKMYCVEMIAKSVEQATGKRIIFAKSMVNEELKSKYLKMALQKNVLPSAKAAEQREYLAIDNLYLNPHCREVVKFVFGAPAKPIRFPSPEKDSN